MAIDAVKRVRTVVDGRVEVDVKRYARVEKIPGGEMEDCMVRLSVRERAGERQTGRQTYRDNGTRKWRVKQLSERERHPELMREIHNV